MQSHDKISDAEAKDRADFDLRWKLALGIEVEDKRFANRATQVEEYLTGRSLDAVDAACAGSLSILDARPMTNNGTRFRCEQHDCIITDL